VIVDLTDAELVRRSCTGSARSFDRLVDRHYARCLRFANHQLGDRPDAEDAVQETFMRAWRGLATCTPEKFAPWLTTILINCCRTAGARRRRRGLDVPLDSVDGHRFSAPARLPEPAIENTDVGRALATLTPRLREAFLLRHIDELGYAEMSRLTGAGESALKMRVKRAEQALARALEHRHDD